MPVEEVHEITGRDASRDVNSRHRYTRTFQVRTSSPTDGAKAVRDDPLLPDYGDTWEEVDADGNVTDQDIEAFCVEKRASQTNADDPQDWLVVVEYVGVGDPTLEPMHIQWNDEKWQETANKDASDPAKPVRNTAKDFFESGLTRDRTRFVVTLTKNVLTFNPVEMADYFDTVNQLPFLVNRHPPGFDIGLGKIESITAQAVWYADNSDIHYWQRVVQIAVDKRGWDAEILNAGFQELVNVGFTVRVKIKDEHGGTPSVPQPLDENGKKLPPDGTPIYLPFVRYKSKDWTPLELEY